jgi:aminoglycoside phosphotransferase (APT) family kinase protein
MNTDQKLTEQFRRTIERLPPHVFAETPVKLLGGNETTIYSFSFDVPADHPFTGPLIVRIFNKAGTHPQQYLWEAVAHNVLADQGFPVPRILTSSAEAGVGDPWLIMERVPGTMLGGDALEMPWGISRFPSVFFALPRQLADLHTKLHAIDPRLMKTELSALPVDSELFTPSGRLQRVCALIPEGWSSAQRAAEILQVRLPETTQEVICHGDFHPLNVMVQGGDVAGVLDWGRICFADPEYDLAAAYLLLRASALNLPRWIVSVVNAMKKKMASRFLDHAGRHFSIDQEKLTFFVAQRAFEELVMREQGFTPEMGQVGGWNFDMLNTVVRQHTDCSLF